MHATRRGTHPTGTTHIRRGTARKHQRRIRRVDAHHHHRPTAERTAKRCTLAHELLHWTHGDARCQSQYDDKAEIHVRKETATLLINPFDYIQSERVYEGEAFLVAVDLNVTVGVLEDYRSILEDAPTLAVEPKGCPQSSFSASPTLSAALRLHS